MKGRDRKTPVSFNPGRKSEKSGVPQVEPKASRLEELGGAGPPLTGESLSGVRRPLGSSGQVQRPGQWLRIGFFERSRGDLSLRRRRNPCQGRGTQGRPRRGPGILKLTNLVRCGSRSGGCPQRSGWGSGRCLALGARGRGAARPSLRRQGLSTPRRRGPRGPRRRRLASAGRAGGGVGPQLGAGRPLPSSLHLSTGAVSRRSRVPPSLSGLGFDAPQGAGTGAAARGAGEAASLREGRLGGVWGGFRGLRIPSF